jgi:hypothetical protein
MGALDQLNLVVMENNKASNAQQHRRTKLAAKLDEQIQLATARLSGNSYQPTKLKRVVDAETGQHKTIASTKRIKEWWSYSANGQLVLCVRYGSKLMELAKGKNGIEVAHLQGLVDALGVVKQAVINGELDKQIEAASRALRAGFKR